MKFNVIVEENQTYEVIVEASNLSEAEEKALENYGCDGEIVSTNITINEIYEKD